MKIIKNFVSRLGIAGELLKFLWKRKMWWLIPFIIVLLLFSCVMILGQTPVIGPFIYTLF